MSDASSSQASTSEDKPAATQAIRQKLNDEKIKLWLAPYTQDEVTAGVFPEELLDRYSTELDLPRKIVEDTLEALRCHALAKLASRQAGPQGATATLKVKVMGHTPGAREASAEGQGLDLEAELSVSGKELRRRISERCDIPADHLKLISCGSVLQDGQSLYSQHVRHGSQVLAICLSEEEREARQREEQASKLAKTKEAASLLAKRKDGLRSRGQNYYLQIADQTGKAIDLPEAEREALSVALTLNEKGRACLKRKQYGEALLILLEAESAFSQCRSEILQAVDNYAVLCLDVVWCYLCLQNINELPDAESKLRNCEECFRRSYGDNLERLASLKGESTRELALYVRLYLLQGILAFYQRRMDAATALLHKADSIRASLQVDEDKLMQVVAMGFDVCEARLSLRAARGDVGRAVATIAEQRQRRKEIQEREREERKRKEAERKLGKTANGERVKLELHNTLVSMGFPKKAVITALQQTNNDIERAIQAMHEQSDLLMLGDTGDKPWRGEVTNDMVAQVCELGFESEVSRQALYRCRGDVGRAAELLFARGGVLPPLPTPSSSSAMSSSSQSDEEDEEKLTEEQREAIAAIAPDIPDHEEDYLDLTLEEEAKFIQEYMARLASLQTGGRD